MKQTMFEQMRTLGYSKCCCAVLAYLRYVRMFPKGKQKLTAYELSDLSRYSRRQVQRCLEKMLRDGLVDFDATIRKGKPAREWYVK